MFLGLAAMIAKKRAVVRSALALAAIFLAIDAVAFWILLSQSPSSTASIGLGAMNIIQVLIAFAVFVLSFFARSAHK
jgi:uncharacterized membrane protein YbhN (UPF0104 family)